MAFKNGPLIIVKNTYAVIDVSVLMLESPLLLVSIFTVDKCGQESIPSNVSVNLEAPILRIISAFKGMF